MMDRSVLIMGMIIAYSLCMLIEEICISSAVNTFDVIAAITATGKETTIPVRYSSYVMSIISVFTIFPFSKKCNLAQ